MKPQSKNIKVVDSFCATISIGGGSHWLKQGYVFAYLRGSVYRKWVSDLQGVGYNTIEILEAI